MVRLLGARRPRAAGKSGLWREALAIGVSLFDPRTPLAAKALVAGVLIYLISPIDIIPDFIPVLGWVDDAILVPLGLWLASRLTPPEVMAAARRRVGLDGGSAAA
jgi:uncharacterized membrane protein YkvA (DUF1232 family)